MNGTNLESFAAAGMTAFRRGEIRRRAKHARLLDIGKGSGSRAKSVQHRNESNLGGAEPTPARPSAADSWDRADGTYAGEHLQHSPERLHKFQ